MAALQKILVDLGLPPHRVPSIITILDYLTNMVYCIELMLKLLFDDWNSHNVVKMYETVFGQPRANADLMREIKTALLDQKYLFEPKGGLLSRIDDMERLCRDLTEELRKRENTLSVEVSVAAPPEFVNFLRDRAAYLFQDPLFMVDENPGRSRRPANTLQEHVNRKNE